MQGGNQCLMPVCNGLALPLFNSSSRDILQLTVKKNISMNILSSPLLSRHCELGNIHQPGLFHKTTKLLFMTVAVLSMILTVDAQPTEKQLPVDTDAVAATEADQTKEKTEELRQWFFDHQDKIDDIDWKCFIEIFDHSLTLEHRKVLNSYLERYRCQLLVPLTQKAVVLTTMNFRVTAPGIWRSGQPSPRTIQRLKEHHGLQTIINLRTKENLPLYKFEAALADQLGIQYFHFSPPLNGFSEDLKGIDFKPIVDLLLESKNHPVLIHDTKGDHAVGLAVAYYKMARGFNFEDIRNEFYILGADIHSQGYLEVLLRQGWRIWGNRRQDELVMNSVVTKENVRFVSGIWPSQLFRAGQPIVHSYTAPGIKFMINLRSEKDRLAFEDEEEFFKRTDNASYVHIPIEHKKPLIVNDFEKVVDLLLHLEDSEGDIWIHDSEGLHTVGLAVAFYRMAQGWSFESAREEFDLLGGNLETFPHFDVLLSQGWKKWGNGVASVSDERVSPIERQEKDIAIRNDTIVMNAKSNVLQMGTSDLNEWFDQYLDLPEHERFGYRSLIKYFRPAKQNEQYEFLKFFTERYFYRDAVYRSQYVLTYDADIFQIVAPGVWRASQPIPALLSHSWRNFNLRMLINVGSEKQGKFNEPERYGTFSWQRFSAPNHFIEEVTKKLTKLEYVHIPLEDIENLSISDFEPVIELIIKAKANNKAVLVFDRMGMTHSGLVSAFYKMKTTDESFAAIRTEAIMFGLDVVMNPEFDGLLQEGWKKWGKKAP